MTSTKKIILGLLGGFAALVVVVVIVGVVWWKRHGAELTEKSKQAMTEGRTFGQTATAQKCLDEVLVRHAATTPAFGSSIEQWDPLESTCRHASLSIL